MSDNQLNKLQIKAEVMTVLSKLQSMPEISSVDAILKVLSEQKDKKAILDILVKELLKSSQQKAAFVSYMLIELCEKAELEEELWAILKNKTIGDTAKTYVLNILKDLGNKVDYEKFTEYFENPADVIDADTQKLLHIAIVNPEAQIDFLDFLNSLAEADKHVLIKSLGEDYSSDDLANILVPLFLYSPTSEFGKTAISILGATKSQLALHALLDALEFVDDEETISLIKKNISSLKIAGVREDKAIDFYKNLLSSSSFYQAYASYPDGVGNQALIFSRERENETIQIVATVINDSWGVVDCFGFNEISKREFERIVDRFFSGDEHIYINPSVLKSLLANAEKLTRKNGGKISYEYICWKTLLSDVEEEPVPIELTLASKFEKKTLTDADFEKIYQSDFIQRWFLDTESNDEFNSLMNDLNDKFAADNFEVDFDSVIEENLDAIFSKKDRTIISKRILMCAYLKYLSACNREAAMLYSLYFDDVQKAKLLENMLKKSIYEYYVSLKFKYKEENKTTNIFMVKKREKERKLSSKQIDAVISLIESLWVDNA